MIQKIILALIIGLFIIMFYKSGELKRLFNKEVKSAIDYAFTKDTDNQIITEDDLAHLPELVANYLRYVGVVGKEKVKNFRVEMSGNMYADPEDKGMKIKSIQYNFIENPVRLFYIKARKMGLPAIGIHMYKNAKAFMDIRLFGLFKLIYAEGDEMNKGETVTVFNDICIMAPAALIDKNIKWETVDSTTVKAFYTNKNITISAYLFFDEEGKLENFISNDRYEAIDNGKSFKSYPWATPVKNYKNNNGLNLPSFGAAVWKKENGDFTYAEFTIENVEYNCKELK